MVVPNSIQYTLPLGEGDNEGKEKEKHWVEPQ